MTRSSQSPRAGRLDIPDVIHQIGNTRLVPARRLGANERGNQMFLKLEGDNPAGSVKDRPAAHMILKAEERGTIRPGDTLIEATSGNTGIALAMVAAALGYRMQLLMPDNMSDERKASMQAYGAELELVSAEEGMEFARDRALEYGRRGDGLVLNQFANPDNPDSHYLSTGPEIWQATEGRITHFVSSMGTTGTLMGNSRFFKEQNPAVEIVGVQPDDGSQIPGIRRWPEAYLPEIFEPSRVDHVIDVSDEEAITMTRRLATEEGILAGMSSGGALHAALALADTLENAVIVCIVCDRGDRYLSSGLFSAR
ncbi:MAG: cysteine synthase B [Gammaproteobacteria bacterium]|nr:MAG: cysteine synthase B [Gammaproteobacteria bacterium]